MLDEKGRESKRWHERESERGGGQGLFYKQNSFN